MRQGTALVVSAPSGAGKSTLCGRLLKLRPALCYSISCTTRPMRPSEVEGKDYFFIDQETFIKKRDNGEFAEWAEVHGNFYGTPLQPVKEALEGGKDILFDIDVQGASQIRASFPSATFVFILPPSLKILEQRLRQRNMDNETDIIKRLAKARDEICEFPWYDAVIVNDNLDEALKQLDAVYLAATLAPGKNTELVNSILSE